MTASHWAVQYLGHRWAPNGEGPREWSCWALVRHVLARHFGQVLPALPADAVRAAGWAVVARGLHADRGLCGLVDEGDVLLLRGVDQAHVGIVVGHGARARVLHADGEMVRGAPVGGVVLRPVHEVASGYRASELWRRGC
jgi:cell wall-associated NlpC family hydrolase